LQLVDIGCGNHLASTLRRKIIGIGHRSLL
jgi:hypothetical protein